MREQPFKVIRCCANRRGTNDFLLALNSNLTVHLQPFLRYQISPSLHINAPTLFQVELEKEGWELARWTCFGVSVPRTLDYADYPTINLNSRYDHNASPSQIDRQTDGRTDEHHDSTLTIRSNERIAR